MQIQNYGIALHSLTKSKKDMTTEKLKLKKVYQKGGGEYITIINGMEVNIMKQYSSNTWVAQTWDGQIDIERDTLSSIKNSLEYLIK